MSIKRDLSTAENRAFWTFVEKTAKEVRAWPEWMRNDPSFRDYPPKNKDDKS